MMARGLEPGCSRSHPVPQDPALAVQLCCLVCRAPGPGISHVWLVSCQGDRVVSADSCLPPPMCHRPLPLPIHPFVHPHATLHPLTVPFSTSPSTYPTLRLCHAPISHSLPTHPPTPRHPPANTRCHPLTNPPKYPPFRSHTIPTMTPQALKPSQASPTCQHITHLPTSHPSSQQPRTLPPALLSTHTSTHHPKHPPIHPPGHFSPHPPTCLLPNLPTHPHPHVKSPALNSQTFSSNYCPLPNHQPCTRTCPHFIHPTQAIHPPSFHPSPTQRLPLSPTTPQPHQASLGSTACSQYAQGAMGGLEGELCR